MTYTYQHKRNGVAISGATSASLAVTNVDSGDDGVYTLEVTNTNSGRTKVFGPKVVVVTPLPWAPSAANTNQWVLDNGEKYDATTYLGKPVLKNLSSTGQANAPTVSVPCITTDGVSSYLNTGITLNGATAFTLWRRAKYLSTSGDDLDGAFNGGGFKCRFGRGADGSYFWNAGEGADRQFFATAVANDIWHTMAIVVASGGTSKFYALNAELDSVATGAYSVTNALPIWFGAANASGVNGPSNATYSDIRIYNKALTANELTWLETDGASGTDPTEANLVACYNCQEGAGSGSNRTVYDIGPNANHGTLVGGTVGALWANRTDLRKDHCILYGGRIGAGGEFVPYVTSRAVCADGSAPTLDPGKSKNPGTRINFNPNSSADLTAINAESAYAPGTARESVAPANTKFRRASAVGDDRFFSVDTALTGDDLTDARSYIVSLGVGIGAMIIGTNFLIG